MKEQKSKEVSKRSTRSSTVKESPIAQSQLGEIETPVKREDLIEYTIPEKMSVPKDHRPNVRKANFEAEDKQVKRTLFKVDQEPGKNMNNSTSA